ncbi:Dabb family protein [Winogradskyella sp. PG-2]|uniref:Dabb family protein n=1 Tax=Winogradskyella sp. PG-2 TaxID=754409 RepID=UPI0004587ADB|nr:Dabb family protein [Winogradskyella sp. PG-2]BAO74297.1 hypothetical protein WPG_0067 [Winogradskyella sp. PG-2]
MVLNSINFTRNISSIVIFSILFLISCTDKKEVVNEEVNKNNNELALQSLRHVVLFKFKDDTSKEVISEIETSFASLPNKIKEIKDFEWGLNNSPEGLDKGFTHCFFVTFENEEARSVYLPHPDHKAFVELLGSHLDDVLVIDYWAK